MNGTLNKEVRTEDQIKKQNRVLQERKKRLCRLNE